MIGKRTRKPSSICNKVLRFFWPQTFKNLPTLARNPSSRMSGVRRIERLFYNFIIPALNKVPMVEKSGVSFPSNNFARPVLSANSSGQTLPARIDQFHRSASGLQKMPSEVPMLTFSGCIFCRPDAVANTVLDARRFYQIHQSSTN